MKDWWNRSSAGGYVYSAPAPRLIWNSPYKSADWFDVSDDKVELFKSANQFVQNLRSVFDIPSTTKICLGNDSLSTDYNRLVVGTKVFDDLTQKDSHLDIFLGNAVCECAKVAYDGYASRASILANVINRERSIRQALCEYPRYDSVIGQYKKYVHSVVNKTPSFPLDPFDRVIDTLTNIIQWPDNADQETLSEYSFIFDEIRKELKTFGKNRKESYNKATSILNIIQKYLTMPPEMMQNLAEGPENDQEEEQEGTSKEGKSPLDALKELQKSFRKKGKSLSEAIEEKLQEQQRSASKLRDKSRDLNEKTRMILEDVYKKLDTKVDCFKMADNECQYQTDRDVIAPYILPLVQAFSKFFISTQTKLTGMRRGTLDTNKLAEAYQNVETVFSNTVRKETTGLDVCLLIDESGSMYGNKIKNARRAAILLNEVFKKVPHCNFFIYGHSADEKDTETVIRVYKDNWNKAKYALGKVEARSNNRDHVAIEQVYKLVRTQTKKPLLMFLLSDGAPACYDFSGESGAKAVRKTVNAIEKKDNVIICQISIEEYLDWQRMFNYGIKLTSLETLASDLSRYILKTLISKLKIEEK